MLAKVAGLAVIGPDGAAIQVELGISRGMPVLIIIGLPNAALQESNGRVRAATASSRGIQRAIASCPPVRPE